MLESVSRLIYRLMCTKDLTWSISTSEDNRNYYTYVKRKDGIFIGIWVYPLKKEIKVANYRFYVDEGFKTLCNQIEFKLFEGERAKTVLDIIEAIEVH